VRNKTGTDSKGASRREGNQTLRTERSGQARPREVDLQVLERCREAKSMRGAGPTAVGRLGSVGVALKEGATRERSAGHLTVASNVRRRKTTQPRKWLTAQWDREPIRRYCGEPMVSETRR